VLLLLIVLLAVLCACGLVKYRRRRSGRTVLPILAATITFVVVVSAAFITVGVPDVTDMIGEKVTLSMLRRHASEDSLERWFRSIGADWHPGTAWQSGEAFSSPAKPCSMNCEDTVQVAFTSQFGLCVVYGERITMHFSRDRQLEDWHIEQSADGC
jgi:hypothetical protein